MPPSTSDIGIFRSQEQPQKLGVFFRWQIKDYGVFQWECKKNVGLSEFPSKIYGTKDVGSLSNRESFSRLSSWHLSAFTTWHLHICVSSYLAISQDAPYAHLHWHYLRFHHYQELSAMAHGHSRHKLHLCGMSSQNLSVALTLSITSRSRWKLTFSTSITSIMTDLWSILCFLTLFWLPYVFHVRNLSCNFKV